MVRKTGIAKRYLGKEQNPPNPLSQGGIKQKLQKRHQAEKITLLDSPESIMNYDDELFLRSPLIDFTFRIEEVAFATKILSLIAHEEI